MWIWLTTRSEGGSATRIAARAKRSGLELVILKAGNERTQWTQLNPSFIRTLRAVRDQGLRLPLRLRPLPDRRGAAEREDRARPAPTAW